MNFRIARATLGAFLVLALAPIAADANNDLTVGPAVESTGFGVSAGYALPGDIVVRAETGNFNYSQTFNANGNTYSGHLNLSNVLIDGEVHPNGKAFYAAVGGLLNWNSITGSTTSTGVIVGNTNYGAGTANAKLTWSNVAPYIGVGFSPMHGGFGFDIGAAFQGNAKAIVTTSIAGVSAADIASAQAQIQNTVNAIQVYPVIGIRYTWGF